MLLSNFRTDFNHLINLNHLANTPLRSISFFGFGKKKEAPSVDETKELVESNESIWDHLSEAEIEKIQNRSNLSTKERDRLRGKLSNSIQLTELYQYKTPYVRNLYAMFGRESGLKPGVCWPRKSELEFKKKYEETFYPSLEQLMSELAEEKAKEAKERAEREQEIRKGLKKLKKYKKEFFERYNKVQSEIKEKEDKEAKRIEEICDFLGYAISPSDPRFEAAAEKKAEIERKEMAKTGVVKKTKQQRMLEELQKLIEQNQQVEQKKLEQDASKVKAKSDDQADESVQSVDKEEKKTIGKDKKQDDEKEK